MAAGLPPGSDAVIKAIIGQLSKSIAFLERKAALALAAGLPEPKDVGAYIAQLRTVRAQYVAQENPRLRAAIEAQMRALAKDAGINTPITVSKEVIDLALMRVDMEMESIAEEKFGQLKSILAQAQVNPNMAKSLPSLIASTFDLSKERATLIAHSETMAVNRNWSRLAGEKAGAKKFRLVGPMDSRTVEPCTSNVGKVKTARQWEAISPAAFTYGLHYGCRHTLKPVEDDAEDW